jgi:hypothetical protein
MEILLLLSYLLKMLVFVAKKLCVGWLDDAWSRNLLNFVFQASSKSNTGPVLRDNATNGISCPVEGLLALSQRYSMIKEEEAC